MKETDNPTITLKLDFLNISCAICAAQGMLSDSRSNNKMKAQLRELKAKLFSVIDEIGHPLAADLEKIRYTE